MICIDLLMGLEIDPRIKERLNSITTINYIGI